MRKLPLNGTHGRRWAAARRFRGWLATWLQDRRSGRVLLPAPVLRAEYPSLLQWDWTLANPYKWNVWLTLDGGVTFFMPEDYWTYGAGRQFAPDGGTYLHFIVGVDANGKEITHRSNAVRPDDAPAPLNAPSGLIAVDDVGSINLSWTDNSANETGFRVYRKPYNEAFTLRAQLFANQTSFADWTAELGIPYTYYVVAYNAAGESAHSNEATGSVIGG